MFNNVSAMAQSDFIAILINELFQSGAISKEDFPPTLMKTLREEDGHPIFRPEDYSGAEMSVLVEYIIKNIDWSVIEDSNFGKDVFFNGADGLYTTLSDVIISYGNQKDYKKQDFNAEKKISSGYWNESITRLIQLICQRIDITNSIGYERTGLLIEQEGENEGKMDLEHLRGAISPKSDGELADLRIIDVLDADAAASFAPETELYTYQTFFSNAHFKIFKNDTTTHIYEVWYTNVLLKQEADELLGKIANDQKLTYDEICSIFKSNGSLVESCKSIIGDLGLNMNETYYVSIVSSESCVFKIVRKPWVLPWYNIDGQTYPSVRGIDKEVSALTDPSNLDFTRETSEELLEDPYFLEKATEIYSDVQDYKTEIERAKELEVGGEKINYLTDVVWGNIDMDNRQMLEVDGTVETVLAGTMAFPLSEIFGTIPEEFEDYANGYFSFTYSSLKQTDGREPEELDDTQIRIYLRMLITLVFAAHGDMTPENFGERIIAVDATSSMSPGIVAMAEVTNDCDNCATVDLGEALHFIGKYGSVVISEPIFLHIAQRLGITFEELLALDEEDFIQIYAASTYRWIRLIMPRNKRKVEIEDLDRNFWVIGQTITAISVYLFDEGGPLNDAIRRLLKEIGQLWENMLYLWAAITLYAQKKYYDKTHVEVIMLSYNELGAALKYDNFDHLADATEQAISNYLNKYINMYPNYNLAILPIIRIGNYEKNYYCKSCYPGIWTYNRNDDSPAWKIYSTAVSRDSIGYVFDGTAHPESLIGIQEVEEYYNYILPLSEASTLALEEDTRFYGLIRDYINFDAVIKDTIEYMVADINFYDIGRSLRYSDNKLLCNFHVAYITGDDRVVCTETENYETYDYVDTGTATITKGFYQGELISTTLDVDRLMYNIHVINTAWLKPTTEQNTFDYTDSGHATMRNQDSAVLNKIVSNYSEYNKSSNSFWTTEREDAFTTGSNFYGYYDAADHSNVRDSVKKARYDTSENFYTSIDDWKSANNRYYSTGQTIKNTTILFVEGQRRCNYESTVDVSKPTEQYFPYSADTDGLLAPVYGTTSPQTKLTGAVISLPKKDGTRVSGFYDNHTTVSGSSGFLIENDPYVPQNDNSDGPKLYPATPGDPEIPITWAEAMTHSPDEIVKSASVGGNGAAQWLVMLENNTTEVDNTNWLVVKVSYDYSGIGVPTSKDDNGTIVKTNYEKYCINLEDAEDDRYLSQIARKQADIYYQNNPSATVADIVANVQQFFLTNNIDDGTKYDTIWHERNAILHGRYAPWYIDQCRTYANFNDWGDYIWNRIVEYNHTPTPRSSYGLEDPSGNVFTNRYFTIPTIIQNVRVYVFGPNGTYSRRGYYRDADCQWATVVDECTGGGDVDVLRAGYYVTSNDRIQDNFEKYKSKFKLLTSDTGVYTPTDDDANFNQYGIAWDETLKVWDTPSNP